MSNVQQNTSTTERLPLSIDEAADAILARWEDADEGQPSEDEGSEATQDISEDETMDAPEIDETDEDYDLVEIDEDPEKETEETEDEDDDSDYEEDEESSTSLDDDAVVDIQVDGKTVQASVKDLKRLYGQEAALTRKSQETARQRKDAEDALNKTNLIMQRMLEKAEERWKPYSEVDMLVASKSMDTEDFAQLRKEAQDAFESLKFLREEADDFYNTVQEQNKQSMQSAAKEAVKVLKDRIPNWSNAVYDDIRGYAIGVGLPEDQVNQYVDPVVIEILNKARLYDQSKKTASIKKKSASSKKILRTSKAPETQKRRAAARQAETRKRLRSSGADMDDIANALLSRWET